MSNDRYDILKYEYVKRRLYDSYVERTQKKFDKLLHNMANLEGWISNAIDRIEILDAELESLRLDKTSVRIAGRHDAPKRKE